MVRSSQAITESSSSTEGAPDTVSVGTNLPDAGTTAGAGAGRSTTARSEEATNFEISKTTRSHIREGGKVERLSVAVLINGTETKGEDGKTTYRQRSTAEMEQIEKLVKTAMGFNERRGDKVEVVNLRFTGLPAGLGDDIDSTIFGFDPGDLRRLVEVVVLAVVGILIILLVVRPLIAKIFEVTPAAIARATAAPEGGPAMLPGAPGMPAALAAPGLPGMPPIPGMPGVPGVAPVGTAEEIDSMIDIGQIEGKVKASSLRKVGEIIEKHPDEAVSIIRNWMYQEQ